MPVAFDTRTTSQAVNRTYAVPVFSALDASRASHALTSTNDSASNGNLVQTAQLDFAEEGDVTVALGFGTTEAQAVAGAAAAGSLHAEFDTPTPACSRSLVAAG